MNEDFELFVYDGPSYTISPLMKSIDKKLPPASTLERGPDSIRDYWNNKNLRKRTT